MTALDHAQRRTPLLAGHPDPEQADPPTEPPARDPHQALVWANRIILTAAAALIAIVRPGPWLPFAAFLFGLGLAKVAGWRGRQLRLIAFALAVFTSAVNYLSWRLSVLSFGGHPVPGWIIGVPLYLAEFHAAAHTVGLHATLWPRHAPAPVDAAHGERRIEPARRADPAAYPVFVLVPTVDEGPEIVGATLRGILAARDAYLAAEPAASFTVIVCNDGGVAKADCSDEIEALARDLGVECVTRTVGGGAKAGNIENARALHGGYGQALLVIFDADQIPREDFFLRTIPPFADPEIGWVQTGQYYGNRDNPVARWADDQQSLFYRLLCPGKAVHNSAFICGTNVVLRAAALDEIGGLPTDSVTEDFAASIHLAPRWHSVYLPGVLAVGLGPVDLTSYLKQQERWARGTLSVLREHWRELLLPGRGGLRAQQRMQYALAVTHYLCGLRDLIFVIAPVLFVLTGTSGVRGATAGAFLSYFVPYYLLAIVGFWHAAWKVTSWRSIVIGYGSFPALLRAAWMTAVGQRGRFTLTPKRRTDASPWRTARPHLAVLALCLASLVVLLILHDGPAYWLAGFWLAYLCAMSGAHLCLVVADARAATREPAADRIPRPEPHERTAAARPPRARVVRRRIGTRLVASTAVFAAAAGLLIAAHSPAPVVQAPPHPARTLVGISAVGDRTTLPGVHVGPGGAGHFAIVGRTMEIGDSFDTAWARSVSASGGVPWLTLVLSAHGRADLDSSLTAVADGSDDAEIQRWAASVAAYGRPIYLTVFPEVDRNYPVTSAVANGGIPQDVQPAWARMRTLFHAAGASNAAWVWNPADPSADQRFSPPPSQIDAVGVTLYEYPGQHWADPATALAAVAARHPGKPLLVDVAVDGPPGARAAWLTSLASAVEARSDIAALVYHNSGPIADPADPAARPWALTADALAPGIFQQIADQTATPGHGAQP
ncbi:MAG TPA: glycosyltransferase family 2 protein [Actinocrinis sp.]|nr:glycosyltransferase family 2 protein [Actinocrinis sp.]